MPTLKSPRHELFAQEIAKGQTIQAAYVLAGYVENRHNAAKLARTEHIKTRISELLSKTALKTEVTVERLVEESRRIAFHNVTTMLQIKGGKVVIADTADLPEEFTAAIAGLKSTKDGLEVKFHDKQAAIAFLGRHKGMLKENVNLMAEVSLSDLVIASYEKGKAAKEP